MIQRALHRAGFELRRLDSNRSLAEYVRVCWAGLRIETLVDVGAHKGQFGQFARANGFTGRIVSFEPQGFRELHEAAARDGNWTVHNTALGTTDGTAQMHITEGSEFSSLRPASTEGAGLYPGIREVATREVPVKRLDSFTIPGARLFLKMDTQGFDLEVFGGATGILPRVVALQSEMSAVSAYEGAPDFTQSVAAYREAGFDVSGFFPLGRDPKLRLLEFDCVLVRTH